MTRALVIATALIALAMPAMACDDDDDACLFNTSPYSGDTLRRYQQEQQFVPRYYRDQNGVLRDACRDQFGVNHCY